MNDENFDPPAGKSGRGGLMKPGPRRTVFAVAALAAGAVGVWLGVGAPGTAPVAEQHRQGKIEFDRYCRACHSEAKLAAYLSSQPKGKERATLVEFLSHHGASQDRADQLIADYLMTFRE